MLRQVLKIGLRKNIKDRMNLWFQLFGMTLGLTAVFLIMLIVANDMAVNKHITNLDQKYRVLVHDSTHHWDMGLCPFPFASTLETESPMVEESTRIFNLKTLSAGKDALHQITVTSAFCADSTFFRMFSVPLLAGDLSEKGVWLNETMARKIFGTLAALNKLVHISVQGQELSYPVVGIYEDIPANASLAPEMILPIEKAFDLFHLYYSSSDTAVSGRSLEHDWNMLSFQTYITLQHDAGAAELDSAMLHISKDKMAGESRFRFFAQPVEGMYLNSGDIQSNGFKQGNKQMLNILLAVAGFISLVILINYLIQNTSTWVVRTREIGVRKVLGAQFYHLFLQVLVESLMTFLLISLLALIAVEQLRIPLSTLLETNLTMSGEVWKRLLPGILGIFAIMVMVPVLYVVVYLNRLPVQSIFMQKVKMGGFSSGFRNVLLSVQYVVFIILFIGSIAIYYQLQFAINKDMGYDTDRLLMFALDDDGLHKHVETIEQELKRSSAITGVGGAMWLPPTSSTLSISASHPEDADKKLNLEGLFVDGDLPKTLGLRSLSGYSLDRFKETPNAVIINECALRFLDMQDVEGEHLFVGPIVAVVEDFHVHSVHREIKPMILVNMPNMSRQVVVRYKPHHKEDALQAIDKAIAAINPDSKVKAEEIMEKFAQLHKQDYLLARSITAFALVAMIIGCMGLLAITRLMLQRQQKELAIRKVNGATVAQLLAFVAKGYGLVMGISFVIGSPLSYFLVQWWLNRFAYAIDFPWWVLGLAATAVVMITVLTLMHITLRTARLNPAYVLRNE